MFIRDWAYIRINMVGSKVIVGVVLSALLFL